MCCDARAEHRARRVKDFFAQSKDFATFTGRHPFDVIECYDEHGDMGNFSGVASVGLAARLMVLKRDGAAATEITRSRCVRPRSAHAACLRDHRRAGNRRACVRPLWFARSACGEGSGVLR
jgi:hypothetical protein